MRRCFLFLSFACSHLLAEEAHACSCAGPDFANELRIGNGIIPENSIGFGWHFTRAKDVESLLDLVEVTRLDQPAIDNGFTVEPVGFRSDIFGDGSATVFAIRPNEWEVGARFDVATAYEPDEPFTNDRHFARGVFEIGPALTSLPSEPVAASKTILQNLSLSEPRSSCDGEALGSTATVWLPFRNEINVAHLDFDTFVNGSLYEQTSSSCEYVEPGRNWYRPHQNWVDFHTNLLVAICESSIELPGLAPGTHSVQIRARIPGTDTFFDSLPSDVELLCPSPISDDVGDSDDDVGVPDAALDHDGGSESVIEAGTGCNSTGTNALSSVLFVGLFAFALVLRRKEKHI